MYQRSGLYISVFLSVVLLASATRASYDDEKLKFIARSHATNKIVQLAADPEVIRAIQEQNQQHKDLSKSEILVLDRRWISNDSALIKKVLSKPLSKKLQRLADKSYGKYIEIIVMDNKGVNVAQNVITSDYWQGDEDKFIEPLKGQIHVENVEYDDSSESFELFASVPVRDGDKVIGVVAIGLNPEALK